jgi:Stage II sporulation protein E (SpoIIE)
MSSSLRTYGDEATPVDEAITIGHDPACSMVRGNRAGDHQLTVEQDPTLATRPSEPGPTSIDLSFQVEVIERGSVGEEPRCHRDAVRLREGCALLVIVDLVGEGAIAPGTRARWRDATRKAGARSLDPDKLLRVLNAALFDARLKATASCAVLDAHENLLSVSCAGAPPPWIVRAGQRLVRVASAPSVELGTIKGAAFAMRRLHFDPRDALILPSAEWAQSLDGLFADSPPIGGRPVDWLRAQPSQPEGGCVLCMTLG